MEIGEQAFSFDREHLLRRIGHELYTLCAHIASIKPMYPIKAESGVWQDPDENELIREFSKSEGTNAIYTCRGGFDCEVTTRGGQPGWFMLHAMHWRASVNGISAGDYSEVYIVDCNKIIVASESSLIKDAGKTSYGQLPVDTEEMVYKLRHVYPAADLPDTAE